MTTSIVKNRPVVLTTEAVGESGLRLQPKMLRTFMALTLLYACPQLAYSFALGASVRMIDITANDIAFNPITASMYATVASSAGLPYGNSVVTINQNSGQIVDSVFVGSEPTQIEVSDDGTRAYIGVDGARAFRSWVPGTGNFGPLLSLTSSFDDPAVAQDFAIVPGHANVVVVAKDEVGSSASGDLEVFRDDTSFGPIGGSFPDSDQIVFVDEQTLMAYNDSSTGFDLVRWNFDVTSLTATSDDSIRGLISGFSTRIEVSNGLLYGSNGMVVNPFTLTAVGTFGLSVLGAAVESDPLSGRTYFLGESATVNNTLALQIFDTDTFIPLDIIELGIVIDFTDSVSELMKVGSNDFAFLTSDGSVGIISVVVPVPTAILLFGSAFGLLGFTWRRRSSR